MLLFRLFSILLNKLNNTNCSKCRFCREGCCLSMPNYLKCFGLINKGFEKNSEV